MDELQKFRNPEINSLIIGTFYNWIILSLGLPASVGDVSIDFIVWHYEK
jgi:hypothetical protein